jgi:hypothetical protein
MRSPSFRLKGITALPTDVPVASACRTPHDGMGPRTLHTTRQGVKLNEDSAKDTRAKHLDLRLDLWRVARCPKGMRPDTSCRLGSRKRGFYVNRNSGLSSDHWGMGRPDDGMARARHYHEPTRGALRGHDVQLEYYPEGCPSCRHVSIARVRLNHLRRLHERPGAFRSCKEGRGTGPNQLGESARPSTG